MNRHLNHKKSYLLLVIAALLALSACGNEKAEVLYPPVSELSAASLSDLSEEITVSITELMASNKTVITDGNGNFSDWIELTNYGDKRCNLIGCMLSDNPNQIDRWTFPELILAPGERKVIFCSENNTGTDIQVGFSLGKSGETLVFSKPDGSEIQTLEFGEQSDDMSLCVSDDSSYETYYSTPGYENSNEGYCAFQGSQPITGPIIVNEVVNINESFNYMYNGYYDWLELKNVSDSVVNLADYSLSDDFDEPNQNSLPNVNLSPGELYVIYCVGADGTYRGGYPSVDFSINGTGDTVFVFEGSGRLSDRIGVYDLPLRGSIGRLENENGVFRFPYITPGKANIYGERLFTKMPEVSAAPGVYNGIDSLMVELSGEGTIFYTTDGSEPDESSEVYSSPIVLDYTTVIRAVSVCSGKLLSRIASFSYIINENHTIPVVSVSCNQNEFDNVYIYYGDHDSYTDANVEYFGDDGTFNKDCKLKLHGSSAREVLVKKHFKLVFSDMYGGDLEYKVFENSDITEYHSLVLRGDCDSLHLFRDSLASLVANEVSPIETYTLNSKYCALYINGSYWGVYALREAYSPKYAADHMNDDEDNIIIKRAPVYEYDDRESLTYLMTYIAAKDMNDPYYYNYAAERFDMESLAVWTCLETYFNNNDPTGNIRYVRSTVEGGKWQMMLFDFDQSMGNVSTEWGILVNTECQIGCVLNSLRKSNQFKELLLSTASKLLENGLSEELILDTYHNMLEELEPEMSRNLLRWYENDYSYQSGIALMEKVFGTGTRTQNWLNGLKSILKLSKEEMHEYFPQYY